MSRFRGCRRAGLVFAVAFGAVLFPGVVAVRAAESPVPLEVKLSVEKTKCELGDHVMAKVTLTNRGSSELQLKALDHDRQSLDFDIVLESPQFEERIGPFRFTKIQNGVYQLRNFKARPLKPGGEVTLSVAIPAIVVGTMKLTARYNGVVLEDVLPFPIISETVKVEITGATAEQLLARITTRVGDIVFRFYPDEAPASIMHFILLSELEFYDGLIFHRVVEDFVVQTGCPQGNGSGGPGYNIPAEIVGKHNHLKGAVAMARADPMDSAGSQFYFCLNDQESLDGWYTVFGQVVSGMEAVEKIEPHHAIEKSRIERKVGVAEN